MQDPVIVYSKPNCQGCVATKRHLSNRGVEFEERDLLGEDGKLEEFIQQGHTAAPVVVFPDGSAISGFRPDVLDEKAAKLAA